MIDKFTDKPLTLKDLDDAITQLNYNLLYFSDDKRKSLLKEKKTIFILQSIDTWLKKHKCKHFQFSFLGNINFIYHHKEFEFHIKDLDTETLSTIKFKQS